VLMNILKPRGRCFSESNAISVLSDAMFLRTLQDRVHCLYDQSTMIRT
jgi:hypothetical protein